MKRNILPENSEAQKVDSIDSMSEFELQMRLFLNLKGNNLPEVKRTIAALERKGVIIDMNSFSV